MPSDTEVKSPASDPGQEVYVFDRFRVHVAACECWQDGERLHLTGKVFDILVVLLRHRDRVVTKEELMRTVWPDAIVSDDSLTQVIRALRRVLGDHATSPTFVSTIPGRGYRFVGAVQAINADVSEAPAPPHVPGPAAGAPEFKRATRTWRPAVLVACALVAAAGLAATVDTFRPRPQPAVPVRPLHLNLAVPPGAIPESGPVLSPDGTLVTYVASTTANPASRLWVGDLATGQTRALEGTDHPSRPFWSPDGKEIAFFEGGGTLSVIPATGGTSRQILVGRNSGGGSWGTNAMLVSEGRSPIYSVSLSGHVKTAVTTLDETRQEVSHRLPQWLPDQEHFLYYIESANADFSGTYVGSLSGVKRRLIDSPALHTPGYLVFVRRRVLFAQTFDESALSPTGEPVTLATDVRPPQSSTGAAISVSPVTIAYGGGTDERFVWFDRGGRQLSTVDAPSGLYNPSLSADQTALLAASDIENGSRGIWRFDLKRGEQTRVTEGMRPLASPDGTQVVFTTDRARGVSDIYLRTLGEERDGLLVESGENKVVNDWSTDGRFVVFSSINPTTRWDLWRLPMSGNREPEPLIRSPFNEIQAQVSTSGRWIAYSSDETGTYEVYLQSFQAPGRKRVVSVGGGTEPHWRADEREIYYLAPDRSLMAVSVTAGPVPQLGSPTRLFRLPSITRDRLNIAHYDVAPDGQRFLVHTLVDGAQPGSLKILVNWAPR
jgi:Tol biopolymer transport system component/DNA-binding winged helix-turn-helix (wHTH) protein